jgi:hypothetical protein
MFLLGGSERPVQPPLVSPGYSAESPALAKAGVFLEAHLASVRVPLDPLVIC